MLEAGPPEPIRKPLKGGIDPAALAIASLAAAVSVIAPPGPYGPRCLIIGVTIICVVLGYDVEPSRKWPQSLAFSAACSLILLLALGYPMELCFAALKATRLHTSFAAALPEDAKHSGVPSLFIFYLWGVNMCLCLRWDIKRCARNS